MNPTTRLLYVGSDVTLTMNQNNIDFGGDIGKTFGPDLGMNLGGFEGLLDAIQKTINSDNRLPQTRKLNWKKIPENSVSGQTFSQIFLQKSISDLTLALDWVMSHTPYIS
jgi:hypothetical protein